MCIERRGTRRLLIHFLIHSVRNGMAGGVDDSGQGGDPGDWGGMVNNCGGSNDGSGPHKWRSIMVNWSNGMVHNRGNSVDSRSSGMNDGRPEHWSSSNSSILMMNIGWGQDGVGRGVGHASNDSDLTLASCKDVSIGVSYFGSLNLRGVDWAHDGSSGCDGEGVAGHPVSIVVGPVMGGEWNSLGGNVGESSRNSTSSVPHGSVGLSSLAVTPGSLTQLILGVVLSLGGTSNDGGVSNDGSGGSSHNLVRSSSNHARVSEVLGVCP